MTSSHTVFPLDGDSECDMTLEDDLQGSESKNNKRRGWEGRVGMAGSVSKGSHSKSIKGRLEKGLCVVQHRRLCVQGVKMSDEHVRGDL